MAVFMKCCVLMICASIFGRALAKEDYYITALSGIAWVLTVIDILAMR